MAVERILISGNIITVDPAAPRVQAVAISEGRFVAAGSNEEVLALREPATEVVDLAGATVLPGLNDSHMHLMNIGSTKEQVDLTVARSRQDMIDLGNRFLDENADVNWLLGRGWNDQRFAARDLPTRQDLDQISTVIPIFFTRACGHVAVANSKALELANIGTNPTQPSGGQIDVDAAGNPTGILTENALQLIASRIPKARIEDYKRLLQKGMAEAVSYGLTSVQSDDVSDTENMESKLLAYQQLVETGELPLRVSLQVRLATPEQFAQYLQVKERYSFPPHTVEYGPIKLMCDGSLGGRTAAMNEPYTDDPTTTGVAPLSQEEIKTMYELAHSNGFQMCGHAIGDRAMEMVLDGFEHALSGKPQEDARPRIIHAQITTPEILERCRELGVVCDIQPVFVGTDLHMVETRIGAERAAHTYAWKTMRDMGIATAGGSDAPVENCNPMLGIYMAVTRQDLSGFPADGWLPEQKLTIEEAIELFTMGSAYASFDEAVKGSITPGKLADFIVLDRDILQTPAGELKDVRVAATYINGQLVYQA